MTFLRFYITQKALEEAVLRSYNDSRTVRVYKEKVRSRFNKVPNDKISLKGWNIFSNIFLVNFLSIKNEIIFK